LTLVHGRFRAGATALADGRVLVVGGIDDTGAGVGYAEIVDVDGRRVDPTLSFFATGSAHNLVDPWVGALDDGTILVAGGLEYDAVHTTFAPSGAIQAFSAEEHRFVEFDDLRFAPLDSATVVPLPATRLAYVGLDATGALTIELLQVP